VNDFFTPSIEQVLLWFSLNDMYFNKNYTSYIFPGMTLLLWKCNYLGTS